MKINKQEEVDGPSLEEMLKCSRGGDQREAFVVLAGKCQSKDSSESPANGEVLDTSLKFVKHFSRKKVGKRVGKSYGKSDGQVMMIGIDF